MGELIRFEVFCGCFVNILNIEYNGDPIGPYRVWLKNENIPGLAMSRSVGDRVAHSVGVISDPCSSIINIINYL